MFSAFTSVLTIPDILTGDSNEDLPVPPKVSPRSNHRIVTSKKSDLKERSRGRSPNANNKQSPRRSPSSSKPSSISKARSLSEESPRRLDKEEDFFSNENSTKSPPYRKKEGASSIRSSSSSRSPPPPIKISSKKPSYNELDRTSSRQRSMSEESPRCVDSSSHSFFTKKTSASTPTNKPSPSSSNSQSRAIRKIPIRSSSVDSPRRISPKNPFSMMKRSGSQKIRSSSPRSSPKSSNSSPRTSPKSSPKSSSNSRKTTTSSPINTESEERGSFVRFLKKKELSGGSFRMGGSGSSSLRQTTMRQHMEAKIGSQSSFKDDSSFSSTSSSINESNSGSYKERGKSQSHNRSGRNSEGGGSADDNAKTHRSFRPKPVLAGFRSAFSGFKNSPRNLSMDPTPSPKIKPLGRLSEEGPMSPLHIGRDQASAGSFSGAGSFSLQSSSSKPNNGDGEALAANRMATSVIDRRLDRRRRAEEARHLNHIHEVAIDTTNRKVLKPIDYHGDRRTEESSEASSKQTGDNAQFVVRSPSSSKLQHSFEPVTQDQFSSAWEFSSRPEIQKSDLKSDRVLDERHSSRSVKTVIWTKPKQFNYEDDHKEKFVLKVIAKKSVNPKHVMVERNVMLALTNSVWHTELVKTFKTGSNLYMMLEYVPNGSLDKSLSWGRGLKQGTLPLILFYAGCVLSALEHMHQCGIVHRDIKPGNLLVASNGYLKLCDYGLSKFLPIGKRTNTFLGTLGYMSPQQVRDDMARSYDHGVDFWALGVTLYELLFGYTPFEPNNEMISEKEWRELTKKNIEKSTFHFPSTRNIGLSMKLFLKSLLHPSLEARLGGDCDIEAIKQHSCFSKFDWDSLKTQTLKPPHMNMTFKGSSV